MTFFENPKIEQVDVDVTIETLTEYAMVENIPFFKEDNASWWNLYANYRASIEGLDIVSQRSFGYLVSSIIGGMGYSCSTECFIREEELTYHFIETLYEIREGIPNETEQLKTLFQYMLDTYKYRLDPYCYKTEKVSMKMSKPQYEQFMRVDGDSKSDKFRTLMNFYIENFKG